jgi:hypothetical protein
MIQRCDSHIQFRFAAIGGFVLLVICLCMWSAFSFVDYVFHHNRLLSLPIGIFWSLLVGNLYLLLLYTVSPPLLSSTHKKKRGVRYLRTVVQAYVEGTSTQSAFSPSMILRMLFIMMLALIIAQPVCISIQVALFDVDCSLYATAMRKLACSSPLSWLVSVVIIAIFLLPVYWKFAIRNKSKFYSIKKDIEHRIVLDEYEQFKRQYRTILSGKVDSYNARVTERLVPLIQQLEKIGSQHHAKLMSQIQSELASKTINRYEYWADHPFCTTPKAATAEYLSENDLLNKIYQE